VAIPLHLRKFSLASMHMKLMSCGAADDSYHIGTRAGLKQTLVHSQVCFRFFF